MTPTQTPSKPRARRAKKAKDEPTIFISKRRLQTVWESPAYENKGLDGRMISRDDGVVHQFVDGRLVTSDPAVIKFLSEHELFGNVNEGWFIPDAIPPAPTEEMQEITQAAIELDADRIREILEDERDGYNRDMVINVAEATLEQIETQIADRATAPPVPPAGDSA